MNTSHNSIRKIQQSLENIEKALISEDEKSIDIVYYDTIKIEEIPSEVKPEDVAAEIQAQKKYHDYFDKCIEIGDTDDDIDLCLKISCQKEDGNYETVGVVAFKIKERISKITYLYLLNVEIIKQEEKDILLSDVIFLNEHKKNSYDTLKDLFKKYNIKGVFFEFHKESYEAKKIIQIETFLHQIDAKSIPVSSDILKNTRSLLVYFPLLVGEVLVTKLLNIQHYCKYFLEYELNECERKKLGYEGGQDISYLEQIPLKENPLIEFNRFAICLEILIDDDYLDAEYLKSDKKENIDKKHNYYRYFEEKRNQIKKDKIIREFIYENGYCMFTHSYETDLFSYKYQLSPQSLPPYYTKNYPPSKEFKVKYKKKNRFISEGRVEEYYIEDEEKVVSMNAYTNYTYFFNSKVRVWHLVITPTADSHINELDIIKIMKLFSGFQEKDKESTKNTANDTVNFIISTEDGNGVSLHNFFSWLTGIVYEFKPKYGIRDISKLLNSGIISIDMNHNKYLKKDLSQSEAINQELKEKFQAFYNIIHGKASSLETKNKDVEGIFKALCGITLGIFDFGRMGIEEISDTLSPREKSITPTSFLTINRGALTSFALGDDVFNSAYKTLGMNPYLMIPSAVLAHNDYVSRNAEKELNDVWSKIEPDSTETIELSTLIDKRNEIDDLINDDILANVFQYPTEQELYNYGMKHRGIQERIEEVRAKLVQLDKIIEQKQTKENQKSEKTIQLILACISLLQIASFFADFEGLNTGKDSFNSLQILVIFIDSVLFVIVIFPNIKFVRKKINKILKLKR